MARKKKDQEAEVTKLDVQAVEPKSTKELNGVDAQTEPDQSQSAQREVDPNKQTIVFSSGKLNQVIDTALYLGKLGGSVSPGFLPRLKSLPHVIKIDLPKENFTKYENREAKSEYDANETYTIAIVKSPDPIRFLKSILELGSKGGIINPGSTIQNGAVLMAKILVKGEVQNSPTISVLK